MTHRLTKDEWGRYAVYVARWTNSVGAGSFCVFSHLDPAIFFVVSGLGSDVDWSTFPDASLAYPYDERNGKADFSPVFRVERMGKYGKMVIGLVTKMSVVDDWIVGNGIAEASRIAFLEATGRDIVELSGSGDTLQGKVDSLT